MDHITVLLLGYGLMGVGLSLITVSGGSAVMYPGLILAGIGIGIAFPNMYVWLANSSLFLGQFLSPILSQPVVVSYDLESLFMIAAILILALVPIIFASRGRLRAMTALPA